jgi:O-antigen/teichoic acid export membrane protein
LGLLITSLYFVIVLGWGIKGIISGLIISGLVSLGALLILTRVDKMFSFEKVSKSMLFKMLRYSVPLIPNGIAWWVISAADRTIVTLQLGAGANGIYAVANKFGSIFTSIYSVFNLSWTESASLHINADDRDEFFSEIYNSSIRFFGCLALGMIASIGVFGGYLIDSKFYDAYNYVPMLLVAAFFNAVVGQYSSIYIAQKRTKQVAVTSVLSAVISIVLTLILVPMIKIYGAALATVVSYAFMAFYRHIDIKKSINLSLDYGLFTNLLLVSILVIGVYYTKVATLNYISLILTVPYCAFINKKLTMSIYNGLKNKLSK